MAKAKALRPVVERYISIGRNDTLHNRRKAYGYLFSKPLVHKLFTEIGPRFKDRPGGYTRILRTRVRPGDAAEMARIELVAEPYSAQKKGSAQKKSAAKQKAGAKKSASKKKSAAKSAKTEAKSAGSEKASDEPSKPAAKKASSAKKGAQNKSAAKKSSSAKAASAKEDKE